MGLALGLLLNINLYLALTFCCLALASILVVLQKQKLIATDTLLGILAHSALSFGLVAVSFLDNVRIDLMGYLFGDLLAVTPADLWFIYGGAVVVLTILALTWQPLLNSTVNEELAAIEGINTDLMRLVLMLLVGMVIAVGMKFVGALIITSLLIIPAATARRFSHSPEQMAGFASLIGSLAVVGGLYMSWNWDTPAGPSVVLATTAMFIYPTYYLNALEVNDIPQDQKCQSYNCSGIFR